MTPINRMTRLADELRRMRASARESSILRFTTDAEPANRYHIFFQGTSSHPDYLNEHELEIWLGLTYPETPPDVRFVTPIFHPNVSRTGTVALASCGITWTAELTLDKICERLWDVARYAYIDLNKVANEAAAKWFREQREMTLPVDSRRLCDQRAIEWGEVRIRSAGAASQGVRFADDTSANSQKNDAAKKTNENEGIIFLDE